MKPVLLTCLVALATILALVNASSMPVADTTTGSPNEDSQEDDHSHDDDEPWKIWPGGIVPYTIDIKSFNLADVAHILQAMRQIEQQTKISDRDCIRFVPNYSNEDYLMIKSGSNCFVEQGIRHHGENELVINKTQCFDKGNLMKSLVVSLGLTYEHRSPIRDKYIELLTSEETENTEKYHHLPCEIRDYPYDFESITHAGPIDESGDAWYKTVDSGVNLLSTVQKSHLSVIDVAKIRNIYRCY